MPLFVKISSWNSLLTGRNHGREKIETIYKVYGVRDELTAEEDRELVDARQADDALTAFAPYSKVSCRRGHTHG